MGFIFVRQDEVVDPNALALDGSNSPSADLDFNDNQLTNVAAIIFADAGSVSSPVADTLKIEGKGGSGGRVMYLDLSSAPNDGEALAYEVGTDTWKPIDLAPSVTANRAVASNSSGDLVASAVTDTELGHLSGVGSAIQTQLDAKAADGANADITSMSGLTGEVSKPTAIEFVEGSAPSTPGTGDWKIYFKSDGAYQIDDAGVETALAGGGSGATTELDNLGTTAINANLNLDAGVDILPQGGGSTLGDSSQGFASIALGTVINGPNTVATFGPGLDFSHHGEVFFTNNNKPLRFTGTGISIGRNATSQRPDAAYIESTLEVGRGKTGAAIRFFNELTGGDPSLLFLQANDNAGTADGPGLTFISGRGTNASPTSTGSGDRLGVLIFRGFENTDQRDSAAIDIKATGGPVSNKIPGEIQWYTTNSSGSKAKRMTLTDAGNLRLEGDLGVGNSASATTPGSVVKKIEIFDNTGTSLGFIAVYDSIT